MPGRRARRSVRSWPLKIGFGCAPCYQWGMSGIARNPAFAEVAAPRSRRRSRVGRQPRRARMAAIALAAGICLASGGAVAEDYYLRGGIDLDRPRALDAREDEIRFRPTGH